MNRSSEKAARVSTPAFDITQTVEAGGEFTMPDYYPEIRRVVSVTADALPDSKYISDSGLEIGGALAFTLLYIGDDGALSSVPYVTEYSHTFPLKNGFDGGTASISAESFAENVFCRPLAPRTVSLRAKVKSRARASRSEDCATLLTTEDSSSLTSPIRSTVQRLEREISTAFLKSASATGNCSGEFPVQGGAKPVFCKGQIMIGSVSSGNERITIKGELSVSSLVLAGDGIYKTLCHHIPFEEMINAEGCEKDCKCAAYGRAASVTVRAEEDNTLSIEAEYDIDAIWATEHKASYTEDFYSTDRKTEKTEKSIAVQNLLCLENLAMPISGEGRRKTQRGDGEHVISSSAVCKAERIDIKDKKATLSGICTFKALIASGGDVICEEADIPFRYECPIPSDKEAAERIIWHTHMSTDSAECTLEDMKLLCRCNMHIFLLATGETDITLITKGTVGQKNRAGGDSTVIRVCYPEKGKRIWDIAKECSANIGICERINRVDRFELSDGSPLIIK